MRAVREIRPPGVYPAADEPRAKPLTVADTRVAGFVGLAVARSARRAGAARRLERVPRHLRPLQRQLPGARRRGLLPERRHLLLRRAHRASARDGATKQLGPGARRLRRAHRQGRLGQADLARALDERGALGQQHLGPLPADDRGRDAAHARPRGRLGRGARQQRQGLRARRAGAHLRSRELRLRHRHRGRRSDDPLGLGDADRAPLPRRRSDLPRGAGVRGLRVAQGSARGVPRAADVAAVASLRAAHHQRRVAADPARGPAVGGAAAAQPAAWRSRRPSSPAAATASKC